MRFFNWAKGFEERPIATDILDRVRRTETAYWLWLAFTVIWTLAGFFLMVLAPAQDVKSQNIGLFLALDGVIMWAVLKIWVNIRLVFYRTLWESQKRMEAELRKSIAEDL